MKCDKCEKGRMVLWAFSSEPCIKCNEIVVTSHIPCDKLCNRCSEEYNCCKECGNKL